jgi:predicted enzyme related to lactoylglutathione lyase
VGGGRLAVPDIPFDEEAPMSTRTDPWPAGTPCWVDLSVPDVAAAVAFYSEVIGWTFVDTGPDYGGYHIAQMDERAAAGIGPIMQEGQPAAWTVYLASDDVDATAKLVGEHGGSLYAGPMDIAGNGRMLIAADPTGGVFGVWQQTGMIGSGFQDEPGSFVWDDARLTDPDAGKRFYADVFGFRYTPLGADDADMADYETFTVPGGPPERPAGGIGGMMGAPPGTPSHWLPYFMAADTDAAVAVAGDGGGTVLMAPENTPYGRIAIVQDPFGAVFGLIGTPTEE